MPLFERGDDFFDRLRQVEYLGIFIGRLEFAVQMLVFFLEVVNPMASLYAIVGGDAQLGTKTNCACIGQELAHYAFFVGFQAPDRLDFTL